MQWERIKVAMDTCTCSTWCFMQQIRDDHTYIGTIVIAELPEKCKESRKTESTRITHIKSCHHKK